MNTEEPTVPEPHPNRYAVPLDRLDGRGGERVAEVGDPREVPDWSAGGGDGAAYGDGD